MSKINVCMLMGESSLSKKKKKKPPKTSGLYFLRFVSLYYVIANQSSGEIGCILFCVLANRLEILCDFFLVVCK